MQGGLSKNARPSRSSDCPGLWEPKQSDLVISGVAESAFTGAGVRIDSKAQVYETAAMLRRDWERTVAHPGMLPCARKTIAAEAPPGFKLVSVERMPFPKVADRTRRLRIVADLKAGGAKPVRILIDSIAFGRSRTGITLTLTAAYDERAGVDAVEVRLAKLLARRIRA